MQYRCERVRQVSLNVIPGAGHLVLFEKIFGMQIVGHGVPPS
jgi:hypothetical protein